MKSRKWIALLLAASLALSVTGCGGSSSPAPETGEEGVAPEAGSKEQEAQTEEGAEAETPSGPQKGGILYLSREGTMTETDLYPHMKQNSLTGLSMTPAVEQLYYLDGEGNMVPQLASSWDVSEDGNTYTFHLQEGVKFHDGSDFNAEAAMWNLQQAKDVSEETSSTNGTIDSMKVIDEYTLEVSFSEVNALTFLSFDSWMFSQKAFEENGLEWCSKNPVGTGPFKFDHWTIDSELVYVANDAYWVEGQPYLDGVTFKVIKDNVALAAALMNEEVDGVNNIQSTELIDSIRSIDGQVLIRQKNSGSFMSLMPCGLESSPLNNLNVRKALAYAIDYDAIVASTFDTETNTTSNQLAVPGTEFYSENVESYGYDVEKAVELLEAEGYSSSNPLKVVLVSENNPVYKTMCEAVQAYYIQSGVIECDINILESAAYFEQVIVSPWEENWIVYMATNATAAVPLTVANRLMGANHAQTFASVYFSDEWVENIVAGASAKNLEDAIPYYKAANENFFGQECGFIGIRVAYGLSCMSDKIHDYTVDNQSTQYGAVWKEAQ